MPKAIKIYITILLIVICAANLIITILAVRKNKQLNKKIVELEYHIENYQEKVKDSGGAETRILQKELEFSSNFMFPIHEEDFLYFTSPYGIRVSPFLGIEMKHEGIDIATVWRAQVVAIDDGVIVEHYPPPGVYGGKRFRGHPVYGGMIRVNHGDYESLYAHLSWSRVFTGMEVKKGEIIGRVGGTGMSQGEHLHFELYHNGKTINPLLYLSVGE